MLSTRDPRAREGGVGPPIPIWEHRIEPVPGVAEPAGELHIRGPSVFLGYLQADGSYAGLPPDGFLRTGDLVRQDAEGCLFHLGRTGGLVKVGGLLVHPYEVEQSLVSIPGVADALCWAEPHPLLGNAIAAQVVLAPGAQLDERALRRECQGRMESHKIPRTIAFVDRLPETAAGKRSLRPPQ